MSKKMFLAATAVAAVVLSLAAPALAHVTVNPSEAAKGGFAKLTFRVPNESDTASTIELQIVFPEEHPFNARVKPVAGWTADVQRSEEGVQSITWTGGAIAPGEFQEFDISGGPLPDDADTLEFRAVQTYDDGEVVRWIDPVVEGEEEPEHPAPTLTLIEGEGGHDGAADEEDAEDATGTTLEVAASDDGDDDDDEDSSNALAIAALVVAVVALLLGGAGFVRGRVTR
jgi:uncharacterized protein YcnI